MKLKQVPPWWNGLFFLIQLSDSFFEYEDCKIRLRDFIIGFTVLRFFHINTVELFYQPYRILIDLRFRLCPGRIELIFLPGHSIYCRNACFRRKAQTPWEPENQSCRAMQTVY